MSKASPIYTNFNSGELSDLMDGRSDLDQYSKGGKDYKNTMALPYGPVQSKPGSFYMADTKTHATISRLLEWVRSASNAQIIEMGVSYFRFFTGTGQILASTVPYEVAHTYTAAEIPDVHYVSSNDVMTLCHGDHKPAKLTKLTASTWSLADYTFFGNPYLPDNTVETSLMTLTTGVKGATGTMTASGVGNAPFEAGHVGTFWKVAEPAGSPEKQGFVEITGYTSSTVVSITVRETIPTSPTSIWAEAAWSSVRGWPKRCWYVQGRLIMANTDTQPNGVWGSKPFIYDDFNPGTGLDDDAISELVPGAGDISWVVGARTLLIGTNVGDFIASGGDATSALTPENIGISHQTGWGSEPIQPKLIGSYAYAVQLKGRKLRELSYFFQEDSYRSSDTTMAAEHITKSGIKEIAYQRNPYSLMPCVLNNGKMALLSRDVEQEVLGWTPWDIDGFYESVAVIPHPTEDHDMIFAIVRTDVNGTDERHVIYYDGPIIPDRQELCFHVDDGLRYNAYEANTGGTLTLSAVTGTGITVTAGVSVFVSGDEDQRIRAIDIDTGEILGELTITQYNSGTEVLGDVVKDFDSTTYVANAWGISVNDISGLDHLEAKSIALLVDGGTTPNLTVASGSVTLPDTEDGFIIAAGMGYTSRWKNMPVEAGSATGTSQGKKKRVYQCGYKFYRSLGMKSGGDVSHLRDIRLRDPATLFGLVEPYYTGIVPPQKIDTTSDYEGHIVIEQDKPLPMCILAVMPLLQTNDK